MSNCEDCIYRKSCVDGANFKNAKKCTSFKKEEIRK